MNKRAIIIIILGELVLSRAVAWAFYQPPRLILMRDWGTRWTDNFLLLGEVLGCVIAPAIVSALARNRPFAWGMLPLLPFWISTSAMQWIKLGGASVLYSFPSTLAILGGCLLVSSGSVVFIRLVQENRRRVAEENAYWKQGKAARHSPEEAWFPPPEYRG